MPKMSKPITAVTKFAVKEIKNAVLYFISNKSMIKTLSIKMTAVSII